MDYVRLFNSEEHGKYGGFGIVIMVAATNGLPDIESTAIRRVAYSAANEISSEIQAAIVAKDPRTIADISYNRELTTLFPGLIHIEEIPNQYCNDWCCRHLSWFIVTTTIGRFKIGRRERVISIDWSKTTGTKPCETLFRDEDVTKGEKSIHAWSMDDARKYIETIFKTTEPKQ